MTRVPGRGLRRAAAAVAGTVVWLAATGLAAAASPAPSQVTIGDPRAGQTAGFAGDPAFAVVAVALIAVIAVVATLGWVRATGGRADLDRRG